ncbi:MAG: DUF58 domain-containing protein [Bacteroidales bacterium]|nr:DUF58 domain-containing protein [Bacteroidales bacterium]
MSSVDLQTIESLQTFDNFEFLARQIVEGFITGLHRSPFHGFSVEFAEHRQYNSGESTKNIDWKLFAKTDKLFTKRFEEETNLRCQLVIDTSSSMLFPFQEKSIYNKLAFSLYSSAALIHLLRKQRDAVGLSFISDKIDLHTPARLSDSHAQMLYAELNNCLQASFKQDSFQKNTSLSKTLNQLAETIHKRSLVIIFSDLYQSEKYNELFDALQHLKYNKNEIILFHVTEPNREEHFEFENRPTELSDMETGEILKINPNSIRSAYYQNIEKINADIVSTCHKFQIDYIKADINKGFDQILTGYLIKRDKLM